MIGGHLIPINSKISSPKHVLQSKSNQRIGFPAPASLTFFGLPSADNHNEGAPQIPIPIPTFAFGWSIMHFVRDLCLSVECMHHDIRYRHAGGDPLIVGRWFDRPTDTPTDGILGHGHDAYQTCRSLVWLFVDVRPGFFCWCVSLRWSSIWVPTLVFVCV